MSFWKGFAQAVQENDQKRTEDRRMREEREYQQGVREEDRAFQRDLLSQKQKFEREMFSTKLEEERKDFFLKTFGGGSGGRGGGGSGGDDSSPSSNTTLRIISREYPQIDADRLAVFANNPQALNKILTTLEAKKEEYSNAGVPFTADIQNGLFSDFVDTSRDPDSITDEEINSVASRYSINPDEVVYGDTTFGDVIRDSLAAGEQVPIFDEAAAPEPMKAEDVARYEKTMQDRIVGYITDEIRTLDMALQGAVDDTNRSAIGQQIMGLRELLTQANDGFFDPVLNTTYGTRVMMEMMNRDNRFSPKRLFPNFRPVFTNEEQVQQALDLGMIDFGDTIIFNNKPVKVK